VSGRRGRPRVGRLLLRAVLAAVLAMALPRAAGAQATGPLRVALLAATPDDPLAGRIEAELRAVGFQVTRAVIAPGLSLDQLVSRELASGARAAVLAGGDRTQVWIAADGTARVGLHQELEVDAGSDPQSVLALRTLEFLRICLGLVNPPVAPPATATLEAAPPPPAAPPPGPERRGPSTAIGVSSGVLAASGGVGPFVVVGASLRVPAARRLGVELCVYAPLNDSTQIDASGVAHTTVWLAGGGLFLSAGGGRRLAGEVAAGALAAIATSTGDPAGMNVGTTDHAVGVVLYGRGAARLQLGRGWALRLELLSGWAVRRPVVVLPDQDVAWGHLLVAGLAGAELRF
jgi:hypothetical protein